MAPVSTIQVLRSAGDALRRREVLVAGAQAAAHGLLMRRDLTVNDTQRVTLGVIAAYVVVIAILWNVPYIKYVLWPFKVGSSLSPSVASHSHCGNGLGFVHNQEMLNEATDARHRLP
jgi:hypothetical protein